jgi:membrane protease YdiL (CAAX protease family)
MSNFPGELSEDPGSQHQPVSSNEPEATALDLAPLPPQPAHNSLEAQPEDGLLFRNVFEIPPPPPPQERIPNLLHVLLLALLAVLAFFGAGSVGAGVIALHLFGIKSFAQAATDVRFTLGTEGLFYLFTFAGALLLFPHLWRERFFQGVQWHASAARHRSGYLFGAAAACFALALVNGLLMPGPSDAPIDKLFRTPGAAWILFAFGVTFAPFFEELGFRGFLLPALSTAFDWAAERATHSAPHPLDRNGHPQWSLPAMLTASVITSILFALLHAEQTGYSLGPFLLLVCVSLVLCGIRLLLRSLAASVLVHASYNFLLFTLMFLGTSGFRHLENM